VALRRWGWLWGPVLAAGVVTAVLLPPRQPAAHGLMQALGLVEPEWIGRRGSQFEFDVRDAVSRQRERVRDGRLADSVIAAARGARALRSPDGVVTVVYESPLKADSARIWLRAAISELSLYPTTGSLGLPVVVALMSSPARLRGHGDPNLWYWSSQELLDVAPSRGACVVTLDLVYPKYSRPSELVGHDASGGPSGRFLDLCALFARFGRPGPAGAWTGALRRSYWWYGGPQLARRMREAQRTIHREEVGSGDPRSSWAGEASWLQIGCLRGASALCARSVGLAGPGWPPLYYFYYSQHFQRTQVVARLLTTGTPAQFAAFWRSPALPAQSLEAAYGRPAGELARAAFSHWYAEVPPGGPRAGPRLLLAGVLWAAAALALALVAGRRWTTEI